MNSGTYFDYVDPIRVRSDYPLGAEFFRRFEGMSSDELHALREQRFARTVALAWQTPFYRRVWGAHDIEPGDIRCLDDVHALPIIDKRDIQASVGAFPPYGDLIPDSSSPEELPPAILQTTSGTTGVPQPILFGPRSREVQNILLARSFLLQGVQDDDVVHSLYGFGTVNGGHYVREAISHYTRARLLSAGTGLETPSDQQVRTMARFGATVLTGFGDYMRRLADVAKEQGLEVGKDLPLRMLSGAFSRDGKESLRRAWGGIPAYDWYGVADTGVVAAEGPDTEGLVVWEDAMIVEIMSLETAQRPLPDGETGDLVITCLFKDDLYPIIRFDTHDLSAITDRSCGSLPFAQIAGFLGRSDNMVKFKGINVYPDAIDAFLKADDGFTGEYVCVARVYNGEVRSFEIRIEAARSGLSVEDLRRRLRDRLGVLVDVNLVGVGETAESTGLGRRQKPRRLVTEELSESGVMPS